MLLVICDGWRRSVLKFIARQHTQQEKVIARPQLIVISCLPLMSHAPFPGWNFVHSLAPRMCHGFGFSCPVRGRKAPTAHRAAQLDQGLLHVVIEDALLENVHLIQGVELRSEFLGLRGLGGRLARGQTTETHTATFVSFITLFERRRPGAREEERVPQTAHHDHKVARL